MNQFTFDSKLKTTLFGFMAVGLLCLALTFFMDEQPGHVRFWSNFLHNAVFFTGIAFTATFLIAAFTTAYSGWYVLVKRIFEAFSLFLAVGIILMAIIAAGIWGHFHHLYHWADVEAVAHDVILSGKAAFLNKGWYTFGSLGIVLVWYLFARKMRSLSLAEDVHGSKGDYSIYKRLKVVAAIFLPIAAFTHVAVVWQWIMSVDAHWYSTLYAWYTMTSWFVACIAFGILTIQFLKSRGLMQNVNDDIMHDLGKYMFAFSVFWTYLWFSQYMLIWYSNNGEETIYFLQRIEHYPVLFYGNLVINFLVPFFVLMRNSNKRKFGPLFLVSIVLIFGHWLDFFLAIKPGVLHTALEAAGGHGHEAAEAAHHASDFVSGFTLPGLLEIGTFLGFIALFMYFAFRQISKASLVPQNDPYIEESLHHHV